MSIPTSADTLIEYSFRRLGKPVVDINVDYQQALERVDDALQFFAERHFDGVELHYYTYKVPSDDISNGYINTSGLTAGAGYTGPPNGSNILSIRRLFRFGENQSNMFNIKYQMSLNDYFGINRNLGNSTSMGLASYDSAKRYIGLIEQFFEPEKTIRFNKVTNRLYIDMDWSEEVTAGDTYLTIEAYSKLDPTKWTEIYNDRLLKEYTTALIKRQWGSNLSKFDGIQLSGGISMRGSEIFSEANEEVIRIEEKVLLEYELPIDFAVG